MQYDIFATPLKDKGELEHFMEHPPFGAKHIIQSTDFEMSLHFTCNDPTDHAKTDTWIIFGFYLADRVWKSGEKPYSKYSDEEIRVVTKGIRKTIQNFIEGRKCQRTIFNIFVQHYEQREFRQLLWAFQENQKKDPNKDEIKKLKEESTRAAKLKAKEQMGTLNEYPSDNAPSKVVTARKSFPSINDPWNSFTTCFSAQHVYGEYQKHKDKTIYDSATQEWFFQPLHHAIVSRAKSYVFQNLLTRPYVGEPIKATLTEYMSQLLYEYHIERGGNKPEPTISISRHDAKLLRIHPEDVRNIITDLSVLLKDVIIIDDITDTEENLKIENTLIRFYLAGLPEFSTSIQLKKMHAEQA